MAAKLPSDTRVALKGPNGEFKINKDTHILVHCEDGRHVEVLKEQAAVCPFIGDKLDEEGYPQFEYASSVLEQLVRWASKYGATGKAASDIPRPCLYRDFSYVLTDKWDQDFFHSRLWSSMHQKHYIATMQAAEHFGMTGLLDFMSVGLGCKLRSDDERSVIIHDIMGLEKDVEITEEDLKNVEKEYPWFAEVTAPTVKQ